VNEKKKRAGEGEREGTKKNAIVVHEHPAYAIIRVQMIVYTYISINKKISIANTYIHLLTEKKKKPK
jgi:hypothetical protein